MRRWTCSTRGLLAAVALAAIAVAAVRAGSRAQRVWSEIQWRATQESTLLRFAHEIEAGGVACEGTFCEPNGPNSDAFGFLEAVVAPGKPVPQGLKPSGKTAGEYRAEADAHRAEIDHLWRQLWW